MTGIVFLTKANKAKVLNGLKTATTHRYKFEVGDVFSVALQRYEITSRELMRLDEVAVKHFDEEGYESADEFRKDWTNRWRSRYVTKTRPFRKYVYDPDELVYFHMFKKVKMARGRRRK